jgi:hypothetical protein
MGGRYATQLVGLRPGEEYCATGQSLTTMTESVHSYRAILPGRKYFSLILDAIIDGVEIYTRRQ